MRAILASTLALSMSALASAAPLRIMPLGDSITAGNDDYSLTPGGYRTTLYGLLDAAGYAIDFVGAQTINPGPIPDNDHQGVGGYQLLTIRQTMRTPVLTYHPDVVLLLGGTNDVTAGQTPEQIAGRLRDLLADLFFYRPSAAVFVGTIPPSTSASHSATSAAANALFPGVLADRAALGQTVRLVDLRALLTTDDLADSLHPNPAGYAEIGTAWYDAIEASAVPLPFLGQTVAPRQVICDVLGAEGAAASSAAVPEPTTWTLALLAMLALRLASPARTR